MARADEPSFAWLTPPGRAGLAVLLLRGAAQHASPLRSVGGRPLGWPEAGRVVHARWQEERAVLDDLVAHGTARGVELHVHGSEGVRAALEASLRRAGFASASESGVVSSEADAPRSLRHARALASARWGRMARLERRARQSLERGVLPPRLRRLLLACRARELLARRLVRPAVVRLVGRPNAGKSTLFNALLAEERALVSDLAGTTRDSVTALFRLGSVPVQLEDTEGCSDAVHEQAAGADLLLLVLSADEEEGSEEPWEVAPSEEHRPGLLVVRGKADLQGAGARAPGDSLAGPLLVSGQTGQGVTELAARLTRLLALEGDVRDDVLAPVDLAQRRLFAAALDLPVAPGPAE